MFMFIFALSSPSLCSVLSIRRLLAYDRRYLNTPWLGRATVRDGLSVYYDIAAIKMCWGFFLRRHAFIALVSPSRLWV